MSKRSPEKDHDAADSPNSVGWTKPRRMSLADEANPLPLECGMKFSPIEVEYETYGKLSRGRGNAILVLHALSGDAHVAGWDKEADSPGRQYRLKRPGWWDIMIGPGKPLDTRRYFVVCANVLGSCYGTSGPASTDPLTDRPYGLRFPLVTVGDWVNLQKRLMDALEIPYWFAVIGGSVGGQQAIEWMLAYPDKVRCALILAASSHLSAQGVGFNSVGRHCIMTDPNFRGGDYYNGPPPAHGLAAARMLAHITYLSEISMHAKFGRRLRGRERPNFRFGVEFEVESYLDYQGQAFVERFDANSYLYISRAMDYYDAAESWGKGDLTRAVGRVQADALIVSFSSDWLYTPANCKELAAALRQRRKPVTYIEIPSSYGHDAFLLETEELASLVREFLATRLPKCR